MRKEELSCAVGRDNIAIRQSNVDAWMGLDVNERSGIDVAQENVTRTGVRTDWRRMGKRRRWKEC